jgi:hypothetical protein
MSKYILGDLMEKRKIYISDTPLIKEWDFERNIDLDPRKISRGSSKRVSWLCSEGHKWLTKVSHRTNGSKCPYCCGQKVLEENSLGVVKPDLVRYWNIIRNGNLTPKNVLPKSNKKVWWQCDKGHEWQSFVYSMTAGNGCPYCAGQKVCKDNSLAVVEPTLAKEWHPTKNGELTPNDVTHGSGKKVWWLCNKKHEWKISINNRTKPSRNGCPYCASRKVCKDNSLAILNPVLAREWHPTKNGELTPNDVTYRANKSVWWQCKKGHKWQAVINDRTKEQGCPYCSGHRASKENCLATLNPTLAAEWHHTKNGKLTPRDVTGCSGRKVWWICEKGHEWCAYVNGRKHGNGCPYCGIGNISKISQEWLDSLNISAENREVWLGKLSLRVDGFDPETKTVYEFLGDYWHGNPARFKASDINKRNKKTFGQLYEETKARILRLEEKGYKVVFIWESDFLSSQP